MSKISLCMIVGNVEEYIERCLRSFLPIADEVVIVRAIGNQEPDSTLAIARGVCSQAGGPKLVTADYMNAPEHRDWPHVDSFAAARQMSFDLATGEYCFWCDSDDILESGAERVRELAKEGGFKAFVFPYKIFGRGLSVPRERLIRRDAGRWKFAVHECFDFDEKPVQGIEDQRVVVTHLPHGDKKGSNERNLRILRSIPEAEMTTGLWYHLHLELALANDIPASIEAAKRALAAEDLGKAEKMEIFLNLAQATENPAQREALLLQAYAADPTRREPLGLLSINALNRGQNALGLAYARQMMATLQPERIEWNHRAAIYDWVGADIFSQALRANGHLQEAENVRKLTLAGAGGPRICLVHATRGRYEKAAQTRKQWLDMAEQPDRVEHIFCIDADDQESDPLRRMHHLVVPAGGGCVQAWNEGVKATYAPVIVQLSDDFSPVPFWDKLILERLGEVTKPAVLAVSDGLREDRLLTMAICTRSYWAQDGWLFHPAFKGMFSDDWFTEQAYARNQVVEARDLVFVHNHPLKTGEAFDKTYAEHNSSERYRQGFEVIQQLRRGEEPKRTYPVCRNCLSAEAQVSPAGVVLPFFAKRVHGSPRAVMTEIRACKHCGFVGPDLEYTEKMLEPLYADYRSATYNAERALFEPGYAQIQDKIGKGEEVTIRLQRMNALLEGRLDPDQVSTVLDWGGGEGRFIPPLLANKKVQVLDVSTQPLSNPNYERVTVPPASPVDYIQICHLLEHVGAPNAFLKDVISHLRPGGYLYLEVPQDRDDPVLLALAEGNRAARHLVHEHINLYCVRSLSALAASLGLKELALEAYNADFGWTGARIIGGLFQKAEA